MFYQSYAGSVSTYKILIYRTSPAGLFTDTIHNTPTSMAQPTSQPGSLASADTMSTDNLQYHLKTRPGDVPPYVLMCGSPQRAEMIAKTFLDSATTIGQPGYRGMTHWRGTRDGIDIGVITHLMGPSQVAIVLPETWKSGGRYFLRIGSCGALPEDIALGDSIICQQAWRFDGASDCWGYDDPLVQCSPEVVQAMKAAALELGHPYHIGTEATTSDFYEGQGRPPIGGTEDDIPQAMKKRHKRMMAGAADCYSMECATLSTWCRTHGEGLLHGAVNAVFANRATDKADESGPGQREAAEIAVLAMMKLHERFPLV